ncbi:hypothetical protein [Nannocystis punicea]|uniref:Uncharacterized protein n=1 Tax=Nannocystis punicea TaxID=2995304 RepID=A0ABY7HFG0_9BACT|nr:hypothetical protein [Nannocystis poenicansa]WAS98017.1 hypothetical protein O0S08_17895 [Nannocystis poenicansa]
MSKPPERSVLSSRRAPLAAVTTALWLSLGGAVALAGCTGGAPAPKTGDKEAAPKQPGNQPYAPPPPDAKPDVKPQPEPQPEPQPKTDPEPPRPRVPPPT